jgi:SpoU rRNA methylase family enzyme
MNGEPQSATSPSIDPNDFAILADHVSVAAIDDGAPEVCRVLQHKRNEYIVLFDDAKQTYEGLDPRRRYTLAQADPLQILDPDGDLVDIVGPA